MLEFFLIWNYGFWLATLSFFIIMLICTEAESGVAASFSFLAYIAILTYFSKVNLLELIRGNPLYAVAIIVAYALLGFCWGIFKWRQFYKYCYKRHDEFFQEFLEDNELPSETKILPDEYRDSWTRLIKGKSEYDHSTGGYLYFYEPPKFKNFMLRFSKYSSLWIFSLSLYLFKDLMADFWRGVYNWIGGFMQRMADNEFSRHNIQQNITNK